jgi:hypothetical protein
MELSATAPCLAPNTPGLPDEPLIDAREAVEEYRRLGRPTTVNQLAKERCQGTGARFYKMRRAVKYTRSDIRADVAARLSGPLRSTAEISVTQR